MKKLALVVCVLCFHLLNAQEIEQTIVEFQEFKIFGTVRDASTQEILVGANILAEPGVGNSLKGKGTTTDIEGNYQMMLEAGQWWVLDFNFLGYERFRKRIKTDGDSMRIDVELNLEARDLGLVTVSASKYEKEFGSESVSIEVLTSEFIENTNAITLDAAVDKVPGVNMIGETINIRGGAGYSANAGSRVLMLLDEVPWLTPQNSGIEFWALPMESVKQVEIIKGASSTLYGSAALNGTLNLITENPRNEPYTKLVHFYGAYENPFKGDKKDFYWSDKVQDFYGFAFVHRRKFSPKFDLSLNAAYNHDESYLMNDEKNRLRGFIKTRFRPKENITVGINMNIAHERGDFFFLWAGWDTTAAQNDPSGDSLGYVPSNLADIKLLPINIDPYVTFFDKKGHKHSFKGRYYFIKTRTSEGEDTDGNLGYGEYNFHSKLELGNVVFNFVTGVSASHTSISSKIFNERTSQNVGLFYQMDTKLFDRLTLSAGARVEAIKLDTADFELARASTLSVDLPVIFRAGLNLQLAKASFLRGSFGQGYRTPSIAEKFVRTVRSGQHVVPNPGLQPETSWSAEVGFKQGFKVSSWMGYLDVAGFMTRYSNLIEFQFQPSEAKEPGDPLIALWAQNVADARVSGVEFSALGQGKIFGVTTNFLIGYTYMDPVDLNYDPDTVIYEGRSNTLNFRFKHSAKADLDFAYKGVNFGFTGFINSFMENIDFLLNFGIPGLSDYRSENDGPTYSIDARVGYEFKNNVKLLFIAKNITNNQYSIRPAFIEAPRNYTVQLTYEF